MRIRSLVYDSHRRLGSASPPLRIGRVPHPVWLFLYATRSPLARFPGHRVAMQITHQLKDSRTLIQKSTPSFSTRSCGRQAYGVGR